jgi:CheY-like chemotaxis protein
MLLCVDDSKLALLVRAHVLSRHGYDVIAADNGAEALTALWEQRFDAIITDYEMPDMDGGQFAAHVKSGSRSCPILLHSGCAEIPVSATRHMDVVAPKGQPVAHFLAEIDSLVARTFAASIGSGENLSQVAA